MIKKILLPFLVFILLLSCDNEGNGITDDSTTEIDTTPPVASISGLNLQLEVATTINISIEESSNIDEVSVRVNQEEILNTKEKTFSFELNPFDYPTGENTLSIVSSDAEGNQNEQSQTFEVNKLLVSVAAPLFSGGQQVYFSVNTEDGALVAFEQVNRNGQIINLYAEDGFTSQAITITSYLIDTNAEQKARLNSIANIQPGTDLVVFQEAAGRKTENNLDGRPNIRPFKIFITESGNSKIANSLFAVGHNHLAIAENILEGPNGFDSELNYNSKITSIDNSLIYTSGDISSARNDEIISLEEYRYLLFENPKDSTISFLDFKTPESSRTIAIPSNSQRFSMRLRGYLNTSTFQNDEFFNFYECSGENPGNTIEAPMINELTVVRNVLNIRLEDGRIFEAYTLGLKDVSNVPDWTAARSGNTVNLSGNYDKFNLKLILNNDPNTTSPMQWDFTHRPTDFYTIPFDSFEFPEVFINFASMNNIDLSNLIADSQLSIEQFSSSIPVEYDDFIYQPFVLTQFEDVYVLKTSL